MADEVIKCVDCQNDFTFTQGEQEFFANLGHKKPRRCKTCRKARKSATATPPAQVPQIRSTEDLLPLVQDIPPAPSRKREWVNGDFGRGRKADRGRRTRRNDEY